MNWDYEDELWNGRREATTIVNLACPVIDDSCFCTAVGDGAPDDVKGADGLLTPVDGGYVFEATTDKGRALADDARGALLRGRRGRHARPPGRRRACRARAPASPPTSRSTRPPCATGSTRTSRIRCSSHLARPLQRLRRLRQRLPHLPLLRHRRRGGGRRPRHAPPLLGHLPGADLHAARLRPQPARRPARPLSPAHQPQVRDLPAQVRRGALHRLRPLHARLPRRPGPRRDPAGDRHRRATPGRRRRRARGGGLVNIYQPHLTTVTEIIDETADTRTLRLEFQDEAVRESLRLQGRPVRRVHRLRRRRVHLLHRQLAHPRRLHRVQLQGRRQGHERPARGRTWATPSASAAPTATRSRSTTGRARTSSSSPAASASRRSAASSGTSSTGATSSAT